MHPAHRLRCGGEPGEVTAADLGETLTAREWTRPAAVSTDLRPAIGLFALACMLWAYGGERWWRRLSPAAQGLRRRKHWAGVRRRAGRPERAA